jgi:phage repressor protein C with HTH and peptisase S24 domain
MSHQDIWLGIERLAVQNGLSTSGLAKKAGLDATSFNKSKRIMSDGRLRWPSTESIMRILEATGTDWANFVALMQDEAAREAAPKTRHLPLISLNKALSLSVFDEEGAPKGSKWDEIAFPNFEEAGVFMLEVMGETYQPHYRDGAQLIISTKAQARRGDRVFIKLRTGEVVLAQFYRATSKDVELKDLAGEKEIKYASEDILVSGRIIWASQ